MVQNLQGDLTIVKYLLIDNPTFIGYRLGIYLTWMVWIRNRVLFSSARFHYCHQIIFARFPIPNKRPHHHSEYVYSEVFIYLELHFKRKWLSSWLRNSEKLLRRAPTSPQHAPFSLYSRAVEEWVIQVDTTLSRLKDIGVPCSWTPIADGDLSGE